ncbi:fatty acyl-AMP ligase [Actinokineospora fastidiosa]|uniref:Fatty-acid--CoA ligase n=1 Tax=Actinokineospora fastidiosa TaxID=1816 RepID=A0A918GUH2_9PSEU|nr:fatty acyl-AMP ligase [Actinokineospora fastidiosa]GGS60920.1 fatty-acid--CoA ligase [Actinokineospora fastidiosa]
MSSPTLHDLPALLGAWAARLPDAVAVDHWDFRTHSGGARTPMTWRAYDERARAVAAWLQRRVAPGEPVAILAGQTPDYLVAFLGALRAGVVAVPLFTPDLPGHADRLASSLRDCGARTVLTTQDNVDGVTAFLRANRLPDDRVICVDTLPAAIGPHFDPVRLDPDAVAYLQYTSGSTGNPRGVMVTHANVVANAQQAVTAYRAVQGTVTVSWLPLFHDMGLMLSVAAPLLNGLRTVLMDPLAFIERPERWLRALSANPGSISAAPSFAYAYCASRVNDWEKARLRLDGVLALIDGSEPVQENAIERFRAAFALCGLRPNVHRPSYGLAEATVFVTAADSPTVRSFDRAALAAGRAVEAGPDTAEPMRVVACGVPIGQRVEVVDPATRRPCPPGRVGEIWVSGPNVAAGYWGRPLETAAAFDNELDGDGRWLATGDLGVVVGDELHITGRIKDLIVVDGRNHYPHDVERTAETAHAAIRPRNAAAFAVTGPEGESAVVLAEWAKNAAEHDTDAVVAAVRAAVARRHGLPLRDVVLVPPDSLPRTSSGKISRAACRDRYLAGALDAVATA